MAIGANTAIDFFGTTDAVDDSSGSVANAVMSAAGDTATWTNDDDAREANIALTFTPSATAVIGDSINLYCSRNNVDGGTANEAFPTTDFKQVFLGSYSVNAGTGAQTLAINIALPNVVTSQEYEFAIFNRLTTVSIDAAWSLDITPKSTGPHT